MSGVDISGGDGAVRYDTVTDLLWNNNKMTFYKTSLLLQYTYTIQSLVCLKLNIYAQGSEFLPQIFFVCFLVEK